MPSIARRTVAVAALAAAIIAAAVALDLSSTAAQSDEQAGRIVARRLDDGRTEFGWQPSGGERVLPRLRYFPANVGHQRWLNSSPVEVSGSEIGRINARLTDDGRIEFGFTPADAERILTDARYFPAEIRHTRWLRSTEITIGPPRDLFTAVSAGDAHTCGLRESGEIVCWGANGAGQTDVPSGRFGAVSAGGAHTCGLREGGEIVCWGANGAGQTDAPRGRFGAVSAGGAHTCGLREGGEIVCWGVNNHQQVDGVPGGRFGAVSAGWGGYSCGLREEGAIECWGWLASGQNFWPRGRFGAVGVGGAHTCGLREGGEIVCWGWDGSVETCIADPDMESTEQVCSKGEPDGRLDAPAGSFTDVSAGGEHTCGLHRNGAIECWGKDSVVVWDSTGKEHEVRYTGRTDAPAGNFTAVSAGGSHTCAIRESGEIECWGSNESGQTNAPAP